MKANALDNPTWYQAMSGPEKDGHWCAMEVEMETLIAKDAWKVVPKTAVIKVLDLHIIYQSFIRKIHQQAISAILSSCLTRR
jgi:hypothetical protein